MLKRIMTIPVLLALLLVIYFSSPGIKVNLSHLDSLGEDMVIQGQPCRIIHIYCNEPDYRWTDADNEGISCVDDVARAAIVYMRAWELDKKPAYIQKARKLLNFILFMQTEEGEFYNFIHADGSINRDGVTSQKSFQFWAARGYWALGEGVTFFKGMDEAFTGELVSAFVKCRMPIGKLLEKDQQYTTINARTYPLWLVQEYAGDATSELLLGLTAFLQTEQDSVLSYFTRRLADGLVEMQIAQDELVTGAYESWSGYWHAWGNSQVQALAAMYRVFHEERYLIAAESSARRFSSRVATSSFIRQVQIDTDSAQIYPQIAYDIRTSALGLLDVYKATQNRDYAVLAGVAASWLTGNNVTGEAMYDAPTGMVYDGIDPKGVNRNAGAESTIEGLYTLIEIAKEKEAQPWMYARFHAASFASGYQDYSTLIYTKNWTITFNWNAQLFDFTITY